MEKISTQSIRLQILINFLNEKRKRICARFPVEGLSFAKALKDTQSGEGKNLMH